MQAGSDDPSEGGTLLEHRVAQLYSVADTQSLRRCKINEHSTLQRAEAFATGDRLLEAAAEVACQQLQQLA